MVMPQPPIDPGPSAIVVALSRSPQSWDALAWAAAEARERCCPLRIVHVVASPALTVDVSGALPVDAVEEVRSAGARFLEDARDLASRIGPGLRVDTVLGLGAPPRFILRSGTGAALIVLGRRRV